MVIEHTYTKHEEYRAGEPHPFTLQVHGWETEEGRWDGEDAPRMMEGVVVRTRHYIAGWHRRNAGERCIAVTFRVWWYNEETDECEDMGTIVRHSRATEWESFAHGWCA